MRRTFSVSTVFVVIAVVSLIGCNKKPSPTVATGDPVDQKLHELAGSGATDCGRLKSQDAAQEKTASDCAMGAAQKKQPFYVAYELPGMTVGVAGAADGKLYTLQASAPENGQPGAAPAINTEPCPAELRVAQSGRVTCLSPGSMGMGMGANPHGGMTMPPATGENPHGGGEKPKQ
jgi:hypothetical protein